MGSLLIAVRSVGGFRDGDVMRAHTRADALAARAEVILRGRGIVKDRGQLRALGAVWDHYARGKRRPDDDGLNSWWMAAMRSVNAIAATAPLPHAEALGASPLGRYPFTAREAKQFLVLQLSREISVDEVGRWPGKARGGVVPWRRLVANGLIGCRSHDERDPATESDVLSPSETCYAYRPLPADVVLES